jgi:hypothetical protein
MVSVEYRTPGGGVIRVERDPNRVFWPVRVRGAVRISSTRVAQRSWRGPRVYEAVQKAAAGGCIGLEVESVEFVAVAIEHLLDEAARDPQAGD